MSGWGFEYSLSSVMDFAWFSFLIGVMINLLGCYIAHRQMIHGLSEKKRKTIPWLHLNWPIIAIGLLAASAWIPYVWMTFTASPALPEGAIDTWGSNGQNLYMTVDTKSLAGYKRGHSLFLSSRVAYSDIDRLTDRFIDTTGPFNISGSRIAIGTKLKTIRVKPQEENMIELSLLLLPSTVAASDIHSLSDVERLHGSTLAVRSLSLKFGGATP